MGLINWDQVDNSAKNKPRNSKGGSYQNDKILKLAAGHTYRVRPVGGPIQFYAYYVANPSDPKRTNRAITADPVNCIIRQKYNVEAKLRYAVNVIDREDGKLKIMEAPPSVFEVIKQWSKATGFNPGSKDGADFTIAVNLPAGGEKKRTEYTTTPLIQVPFTASEIEMLKKQGLYDLEENFKATPQDEIEAKLYPNSTTASSTANATVAKTANTAKVPSDSNDLGF
jgi:hypothetical protein